MENSQSQSDSSTILAIYDWSYVMLDTEGSKIQQRNAHSRPGFMTKHINEKGEVILHIDADIPYRDAYYNNYNIGSYGIVSDISIEYRVADMFVKRTLFISEDVSPSSEPRPSVITAKATLCMVQNSSEKEITVCYHVIKHANVQKLCKMHVEIPVTYYNEWVRNTLIAIEQMKNGPKLIEL